MKRTFLFLAVALVLGAAPTSAAKKPSASFSLKITMESVAGSDWVGRLQLAGGSAFSDSGSVTGPVTDVTEDQSLTFVGKRLEFAVRIHDIRVVRVRKNGVSELEASFHVFGVGGGSGTGKRTESGDTVEHMWTLKGYLDGAGG